MRIALFQPDQPGNVGAILRLGACLGVPVDVIEPCGFAFSARALKRAAMDYGAQARLTRHPGWDDFLRVLDGRLLLFTTAGERRLPDVCFEPDDTLLFGSESTGAPPEVHHRADLRLRIPQVGDTRSLNIAIAAGIALTEALRQTDGWPR